MKCLALLDKSFDFCGLQTAINYPRHDPESQSKTVSKL